MTRKLAKEVELKCTCGKVLTKEDGCPFVRGQVCERYKRT